MTVVAAAASLFVLLIVIAALPLCFLVEGRWTATVSETERRKQKDVSFLRGRAAADRDAAFPWAVAVARWLGSAPDDVRGVIIIQYSRGGWSSRV